MRKRKDGLKKISIKTIILIILSVFLVTISVGYSYLQQKLTMTGKSTIVKSNGTGQIINGESTYNWTLVNSWGGGSSSYIYQIKIELFNKDEDIAEWELSFDVPVSYDDAGSNIWIASSKTYENGRLTLRAQGWNASVASGTTLTLEFQLAFTQEEMELISNLELIDASTSGSEETDTSTSDLEEADTSTSDSEETNTSTSNSEGTDTTTSEPEETDTSTLNSEQTNFPIDNE